MATLTTNTFGLRSLLSRYFGHKRQRDLWKQFGYPTVITPDMYYDTYKRGGVANRIVKSYPQSCWRHGAVIRDDAGAGMDPSKEGFSAFALQAYQLFKGLNVFRALEKADRLARTGQYGILVMGFRDGRTLAEELTGGAELVYLSAYPERSVTITQWESDQTSPRYGQPTMYRVQPSRQSDEGSPQSVPVHAFTVHHSRVLHIAENTDDNDVFGEPALRPAFNYLLDLEKLTGASTETFWLNARGGMAIEASADSKFTQGELDKMQQQAQEYEDQLRRIMAIQGASVKSITSNVSSPQYNAELLYSLISGTTGIPQRILFGSERGELASSQDENSYEGRVDERRVNYCGPSILQPFVDKMIATGNLNSPVGDWWVDWPEASAATPEKEAEIAHKRTQSLVAYANSSADQIVPPEEFRPWLGLEATSDFDLAEPDDADDLGDDLPDDEDDADEGGDQ